MWICKNCSAIINDDELAMCQNCGEFIIREEPEDSKNIKDESGEEIPVDEEVLNQIKKKTKGKIYKIEEVGMQFSDEGIQLLENQFNANSKDGWNFHSVIQIQKQKQVGCLSTQTITISTYLAIYTR